MPSGASKLAFHEIGPEACVFYRSTKVGQGFSIFSPFAHHGALGKRATRPYLGVARFVCAALPMSNTRKERNDDDDIDDLHPNCRVFDRSSNQHAWRQTLARDLSLETNVTRVTPPSQ